MKPLPSSLRAALSVSILALALVALAWAFIGGLIRYELDDTVREVERQNANLALAFEEHSIRTIRSAVQLLQFVQHEALEHGAIDIGELAKAGKIDGAFISQIVVLDTRGTVLIGNHDGASANLGDREFFSYHRDHPGSALFIGKPVQGRLTGQRVFPVSRRIETADGAFNGVVVAGLNPDYFGRFYSQMDIGASGMVLLVGVDGITRARRAGGENSSGQDMNGSTLMREQAKRPNGSFFSAGRVEGVRRFTSYRTIGEYGLILAVGTSEAEALAPFYERRRVYLWSGGIFTLLVAAVAALLLLELRRRREAIEQRLGYEAGFRATFDQASVGIAHVAPDGRFLKVNGKLCDLLGYPRERLMGLSFLDLKFDEDRAASATEIARLLRQAGGSLDAERRYRRSDGSAIWLELATSLVRDAAGRPEYFVAMAYDITERRRAQERVLHQATHDPLTDLPNRALFADRLGHALRQARRRGNGGAVMFMDLDHFKLPNDRFGHAAGDALLRETAKRLSGCVRGGDTVARIGGDEFAVVLSETAQPQDAAVVARKIIDSMRAPMSLEGNAHTQTVSIGIALFPTDGKEVDILTKHADEAMFRAKEAGRNGFRFHEAASQDAAITAA
jgi:diguanylate cyclase (GGDEF)-like protein/PAS domain S-box-containing protein